MKKGVLLVFLLMSIVSFGATPLKVSLISPVELPQTEDVTGLSVNLIYGYSNSVTGIETGIGMNHTEELFGIQYGGMMNKAESLTGIQVGVVNRGNGTGLQLGVFNTSSEFRGIQFGVINYAESLQGIQIGAANINFSGLIPVLPVINFSFSF